MIAYVFPSDVEDHVENVGKAIDALPAYGALTFLCDGTDDHVQSQAALTALAAYGGGQLHFLPGSLNNTSTLTYDPADGLIDIFANGGVINYDGDGRIADFLSSGDAGHTKGIRVHHGRWVGTSSAAGGIRWSDCFGTVLDSVAVEGCSGAGGFELWNEDGYTENSSLINCISSGNKHAINFSPASVTGGAGTESFARTHVINLRHGGSGTGPVINCRGGVYGSTFIDVHGNVSGSPKIFHCEGSMGGTLIIRADFEGSAFTYFEWGSFTGNGPNLIGPFTKRSSSVFETGTRPSVSLFLSPSYSAELLTLRVQNLPTSDPSVAGVFYKDSNGFVKVSSGA